MSRFQPAVTSHDDGTRSVADGYVGFLAQAAARWPGRIGLRFETTAWTYRQLSEAAETAARRLAGAGVGVGTRVLLLLENCPEYLIAQFALARLGAVFVTPNPYWTEAETAHAVSASQASAAIYVPRFARLAARLEVAVPVSTLLDGEHGHLPPKRFSEDGLLYVPFSSGTMGMPKGVLHTERSLCGAVAQLRHHLALTERDRLQMSLPLCHIFGATMSAAAISAGAEITLFRRFDLDESLRHIRDTGVTIWPMAGAVAHRLIQRDDLRPADFASLRLFVWGGSAVPVEYATAITARTGVPFLCSYGMTEAMMVAFNPIDRPDDWRLDSPGYPTAGTQLRLTETGELQVRGPSVAAGYAGTSGAESAAFTTDGWFHTGDLAEIDPNGRVRILDRIKDMIKVSGFQVAPSEVENALLSHPLVTDVAIVGRPDERTGETPVAFVVTAGSVSVDVLDAWLGVKVSTYKRPTSYVFVDDLPRTVGGKLQRGRLRAGSQ